MLAGEKIKHLHLIISHLKRDITSQKKIIKLLTRFYDTTQTALEQQRIGHTNVWDSVHKLSNKIDDLELSEFRNIISFPQLD